MEPTELYNRSKRNLVIFTAFLALILLGRVHPDEGAKLLGFRLLPEALPAVLSVVVLYLLFQFVLASTFQSDAVRARLLHRWDFGIVATLAVLTLGGTAYSFIAIAVAEYSTWSRLAVGVAAGLVAGIVSSVLLKFVDITKWRRDVSELRKITLEQRLKGQGWVLNFDPVNDRVKPISFEDNGMIGHGRNNNEHSWQLENDHLVIKRSDNEIQNIFAYRPEEDRFESIGAKDAKGSKRQFIYRREGFN